MLGIAGKMSDLLSGLSSSSQDSTPAGSPAASRRPSLAAPASPMGVKAPRLRNLLRGFVFEGTAGSKDMDVTSQAEYEVRGLAV